MLYYILVLVLGIAALGAYFSGVRRQKRWGAPVMAILALGALVSAFMPQMQAGLQSRFARRRADRTRFHNLELLARRAADELSPGAEVLVITWPDPEEADTERRKAEIEDAFRQGASGEVSVYAEELRGALIGSRDADTFNRQVLDGYEARAPDLIVSLVGLPEDGDYYDLEYLNCFDWDNVPLFAADLTASDYDADIVGEYIRDGLLFAALIRPGREEEPVVVCADNIDELLE